MTTTTERRTVSLDFTKLEFLAAGTSGLVYGTDDKRVTKKYYDVESNGVFVGRQVFARLGSHSNMVRFLGVVDNGRTVLERGWLIRFNHWQREREGETKTIPLYRKFRRARDAALGLQHIHENGILQANVGCHNLIVIQDHAKLIDFERYSIDGSKATSCYE